ncbi:MAG: hypothetical protein QXT53_00990 [Ignisphaera sp.]
MFLSSGNRVVTIDASTKALGKVIAEQIVKGFTGRITYRDASRRVFISIEMIRGVVQACRAVEMEYIFEGGECENIASNYLYAPNGSIEVIEIGEGEILRDIIHFPHSIVSGKGRLMSLLQINLGEVSRSVASLTPQAQSSPAPVSRSQSSPTKQEVAIEKAAERAMDIAFSNECIDPLNLYTIVRNGTIQSISEKIGYQDAVKRIDDIARSRKAKQIYLSANLQDGVARIVIDIEKKAIHIEFEDSKGNLLCGKEAVKQIENKELSNAKIWIFE